MSKNTVYFTIVLEQHGTEIGPLIAVRIKDRREETRKKYCKVVWRAVCPRFLKSVSVYLSLCSLYSPFYSIVLSVCLSISFLLYLPPPPSYSLSLSVFHFSPFPLSYFLRHSIFSSLVLTLSVLLSLIPFFVSLSLSHTLFLSLSLR